jgi:hypothetical protein
MSLTEDILRILGKFRAERGWSPERRYWNPYLGRYDHEQGRLAEGTDSAGSAAAQGSLQAEGTAGYGHQAHSARPRR